MKELINRLGGDAYCQNLIVNGIENMGSDLCYRHDSDDYTLIITKEDGKIYASVKYYDPNVGWCNFNA
jgi:hypothetical protein